MLKVLIKNVSTNVVLIREDAYQNTAVSTFDHNDLNAYLLVVVGLAHPTDDLVALYDSLAKKAQAHESIPLRDIQVSAQNSPYSASLAGQGQAWRACGPRSYALHNLAYQG